jgi:hypothetical protein
VALNLKYQTAAQFAARLRERYRHASREEAVRIATWILNRIEAGDITDTQVRNAFGLTAGQYTTLKSKWTNLRTNWLAVQSAQGE